jgi:broad specificity phosphatase PhoE
MQITLIRHLPTEWNKKLWLQGRRDIDVSPPTEVMNEEINSNKRYLEKLSPFDLVLASSLKRTQQTAQLYGYNAVAERLLDELDFGPFEGGSKKKLIERYGNEWLENPRLLVLGESLQDLEKRITNFLEKFNVYENILVFGHGSWIRAFLSYKKYGDINQMNKLTVKNNECITISVEATSPRK